MSDLIERLRQLENVYKSRFKGEPEAGTVFGNAADEIERLTTERDRATAKVLQIDAEYVALQARVDALEAENRALQCPFEHQGDWCECGWSAATEQEKSDG